MPIISILQNDPTYLQPENTITMAIFKAVPMSPKDSIPPSYQPEWRPELRDSPSSAPRPMSPLELTPTHQDVFVVKKPPTLTGRLLGACISALAYLHPDPQVERAWSEQAAIAISAGNERERVFEDFFKGFMIVFVVPFALAAITLFSAGAILYGVGKIVVGFGHILTFGQLKR
jgi:hypothetical protein